MKRKITNLMQAMFILFLGAANPFSVASWSRYPLNSRLRKATAKALFSKNREIPFLSGLIFEVLRTIQILQTVHATNTQLTTHNLQLKTLYLSN